MSQNSQLLLHYIDYLIVSAGFLSFSLIFNKFNITGIKSRNIPADNKNNDQVSVLNYKTAYIILPEFIYGILLFG